MYCDFSNQDGFDLIWCLIHLLAALSNFMKFDWKFCQIFRNIASGTHFVDSWLKKAVEFLKIHYKRNVLAKYELFKLILHKKIVSKQIFVFAHFSSDDIPIFFIFST